MKPTANQTAALLCVLSPISFAKPLKVFILAGQSNMEGQGSVDHDGNEGKGNLVWSMKHSKSADKMKKLKNEKGEWVVRDDVQICLNSERRRKKEQNRSRMLYSSRPPILPGRQNSRPVPRMDITGAPMRRVTFLSAKRLARE